MKQRDPNTVLAISAAVVIVALTAGAFALSYAHLHDVAADNGMPNDWRAWTWPGCLDAFIVAGELLMLRAALQRTVDWWAVGLTAAGSIGSIVLNVAGVGTHASPLEYVVAGIPPAAALLAFGALMRQVHQRIAEHAPAPEVHPESAPDAAPGGLPAPPHPFVLDLARTDSHPHPDVCAPAPVAALDQPRTRVQATVPTAPPSAPAPAAAPGLMRPHTRSTVKKPAPAPNAPADGPDPLTREARDRFHFLLKAQQIPSLRALRSEFGIGQTRAQNLQTALKN